MRSAFTLVELLVVVAIVAVLAGLLFPVFGQAKEASRKSACLSNSRQIGLAVLMYADDYDGTYPQAKQSSSRPEIDDADGSLEDPSYGSVFARLFPYAAGGSPIHQDDVSRQRLFTCPSDPNPLGTDCFSVNPDAPPVTSYIVNGFFVWGLSESSVSRPAETIYLSERRSVPAGGIDPYCDDLYHPWFNPTNEDAPSNEMDPNTGAVATQRHSGLSTFTFTDGHAKAMAWSATFAPPTVDLHSPR